MKESILDERKRLFLYVPVLGPRLLEYVLLVEPQWKKAYGRSTSEKSQWGRELGNGQRVRRIRKGRQLRLVLQN